MAKENGRIISEVYLEMFSLVLNTTNIMNNDSFLKLFISIILALNWDGSGWEKDHCSIHDDGTIRGRGDIFV